MRSTGRRPLSLRDPHAGLDELLLHDDSAALSTTTATLSQLSRTQSRLRALAWLSFLATSLLLHAALAEWYRLDAVCDQPSASESVGVATEGGQPTCSLLFQLSLPSAGGEAAAALFAAGAAGKRRKLLPGGSCADDPAAWTALLARDEWWHANRHSWALSTCPAALSAEPLERPPGSVGTSVAPALVPGPLLVAMRAARAQAERRGCVFLSFATVEEPALVTALTWQKARRAGWVRRSSDNVTLLAWAHAHPETLLVEHLARMHLPSGDGPGSDAALTPTGPWADAAREGGLAEPAAGAAPLEATLAVRPDWRCEPAGDADMLRVCGHMVELHGVVLRARARLLNLRGGFTDDAAFQALCGMAACGELAAAATADAESDCCRARHEEVDALHERFAASRGAFLRFKRGAHGCSAVHRGAARLLFEFDLVAPAARLEEAALLVVLGLGAPEREGVQALAAAAAATNLSSSLAAAKAARADLDADDWLALRSFNACGEEVYVDLEQRFHTLMSAAGQDFSELLYSARRRRMELAG